MLARYLRDGGRVRYAMDPAHLAAIQNYLRFTTRRREVPETHDRAMVSLLPHYEGTPALPHAWQEYMQSGDPASLAAYLDLMGERGVDLETAPAHPHAGVHPLRHLLETISLFHELATLAQKNPMHVYGYRNDVLGGDSIGEAVRAGMNVEIPNTGRSLGGILRSLSIIPSRHGSELLSLVGGQDGLLRGHRAERIPDVYDHLRLMGSERGQTTRIEKMHAQDARRFIADGLLRQHVNPVLQTLNEPFPGVL